MDLNQIFHLHVVTRIKIFCFLSFFLTSLSRTSREGEIRLVGGACQLQGRLEIFHNGIWGTVCDDSFGYNDAIVVCKQLGSSSWTNVQFYTSGDGMGHIWLDDISCSGHETKLSSCGNRGWGTHNCGHTEDVGIWCFDASEGDLRLIGGTDYGRLEIYHSNSWGSICDDGFTKNNAIVACRQLKLRSSNAEFYTAGNGDGMIWLDDVNCTKTKAGIDMCSNIGWGVNNCGHSEDVGVRCYGSHQIFKGDLRLVGGNSPREGRLEVYYNYQWGTVCSDHFDIVEARVACKQLGYSTDAIEIYKPVGASSNTKIWMDDVRCTSYKTRLEACSRRSWGSHDCSHFQDIGIKCFGKYVVSGNWGQWTAWGMCSFSCGNGNQSRRRRCNSPIPSAGGSDCNGTNIQTQTCNVLSCPVDGDWSGWSAWNSCSATCNGGIQDRTRKCKAPQPSNGGLYCNGTPIKSRPCNNVYCEIHGHWGSWQEWESCNTTCGNGFKQRSRNCDSPPPMFNGSECIGLNFDIEICNKDICPGIQGKINDESSKPFSVELLVGVAGGCIVVTAIIIFIGLFAFRRFKPGQFAKSKRNAGKNKSIGDSRVTSQPNDYGRSGRSSGTHSGVYDNIEIGGHTNTQLNCHNEEIYENLKL
ncbi:neurotrypsin-like [Mytilus californianus]|uniref:neurotrypsin-like n=1 Tax=Mytilus californianus TaxID=6549 RepID=UPI0022476126|nr:neurotrypsin-like [Mytilus californianus]